MTERRFDPNPHLATLRGGKPYLEVKWRLVWLRTVHPDAHIVTDLLWHDPASGFAQFRAAVTIPNGGSATGHGSETATDFGDYLEKAETKALGRALAALGFGAEHSDDFAHAEPRGNAPQSRQDRPQRAKPSKRAPDTTPQPTTPQRPNGDDVPPNPPVAAYDPDDDPGDKLTAVQLAELQAIAADGIDRGRTWADFWTAFRKVVPNVPAGGLEHVTFAQAAAVLNTWKSPKP